MLPASRQLTSAQEHTFAGRDAGRNSVFFGSGSFFHAATVSGNHSAGSPGLCIAESTVRGTTVSFDIKNDMM